MFLFLENIPSNETLFFLNILRLCFEIITAKLKLTLKISNKKIFWYGEFH